MNITLEDAINHGRAIINEYSDFVRGHEIYTRYTIIDPILWGLGWRTWRPTECEVEYQRGSQGRVDYALFGPEGEIVVLLEAKRLGNNAADHEDQLSNYTKGLRQGLGVLVDGQNWHFYDLVQRGPFENKYLSTVDICLGTVVQSSTRLSKMLGKDKWWNPGEVGMLNPNRRSPVRHRRGKSKSRSITTYKDLIAVNEINARRVEHFLSVTDTIELIWQCSTSNDQVEAYHIQRQLSENGGPFSSWDDAATQPVGNATEHSFSVPKNIRVRFRIRAKNSTGWGPWSKPFPE